MSETICHRVVFSKNVLTEQPAIRFKKDGTWTSLSWLDYYETIEACALGLHGLGVKKGAKVAIFSQTRHEWSVSDFALLGLGSVVVPIYPSSLAEEVEFILQNSGATTLILDGAASLKKWKSVKDRCSHVETVIAFETKYATDGILSFEQILETGKAKRDEKPAFFQNSCKQTQLKDLATIVYTSGTTGQPKGVMLTHEQIMSEVEEVFQVIQISEADCSLSFLPYAHILGRVEQWAHMHRHFCLCYAESIERIKDNLAETHPTFLIAVPRIFEKLYVGILAQLESQPAKKKLFQWAIEVGRRVSQCKLENRTLPLGTLLEYQLCKKLIFDKISEKMGGRLRFSFCGGAPLSSDISRFFHATGLLILEGYGLTETTAAVFVNSPYNYRFGCIGKPIGDVQVKLASDGELLIKSKKVMKGYYQNDSADNEVFDADGWFHTGDIGEWTADGFMKITDRKKDLIKTAGGKYVAPQKLENLLKLNKYVSNVLIHGDRRKYIVALLTMNENEIQQFAQGQGISAASYDKLTEHQRIRDLYRQAVAEVNAKLASFETIKNFDLLPADFTIENGELTPSLKVKRKFCDKKYFDRIEKLYGPDSKFVS